MSPLKPPYLFLPGLCMPPVRGAVMRSAARLGFGRIVASEIKAPKVLANLVWSG